MAERRDERVAHDTVERAQAVGDAESTGAFGANAAAATKRASILHWEKDEGSLAR